MDLYNKSTHTEFITKFVSHESALIFMQIDRRNIESNSMIAFMNYFLKLDVMNDIVVEFGK